MDKGRAPLARLRSQHLAARWVLTAEFDLRTHDFFHSQIQIKKPFLGADRRKTVVKRGTLVHATCIAKNLQG